VADNFQTVSLGTWVNKGPSRANGPGFNKGTPDPFAAAIGFVPTIGLSLGVWTPSDRWLCLLHHGGWLAGFAALSAVEEYGRLRTRNNNVGRSVRS
jgi:hypothetical protein